MDERSRQGAASTTRASAWPSPSSRPATSSAPSAPAAPRPHLLDRVNVDYYGAVTPLNQLATISATEARLLTITPYDKASIKAIEKAILESDVGLTPNNDGNLIRLAIPELTEERRKRARQGRPRRSPRRAGSRSATCAATSCTTCASCKKDGDVGADDEHRAEAELQKLTDEHDRRDRRVAGRQGGRDPRGLGSEPAAARTATAGGTSAALRRDHHRRQRPLGASSAGCRRSRATAPAPTSSRRGCATPSSSGVEELTVYSFSTENWTPLARGGRRPDGDVRRADRPRDAGAARGGRADALHRPPRGRLRRSCASRWTGPRQTTAGNTRITLFVAFNYGGRAEIVDAARALRGRRPRRSSARRLYAPEMHDPDLLIRTSGEQRTVELPAVAVRLLRARLPRRAVARLRPRGVRGVAGRVRPRASAASAAREPS